MFNHDEAANVASLQAPAGLSANVVLPGHGQLCRGSRLALSSWPWPPTAEHHRTARLAVAGIDSGMIFEPVRGSIAVEQAWNDIQPPGAALSAT